MSKWPWRRGVGAALCLALGACAGAGQGPAGAPAQPGEAPAAKPYAGDAHGPPRMEGLPECDVSRQALSPAMRRAWLLSEEALAVPPPDAPDARDGQSLSQWSDSTLRDWMQEKSEKARAARAALNEAAQQGPRARILAGALLGLVFEDVARVLVDLPMPAELRTEPDVEATYREVMISNAKPYLAHAEAAYRACAGNARHHDSLGHWGRYCRSRLDALPGAEPDAPPEGTTEVIVERE